MIGQKLLHYEIKEKIGQGGMGEVFRALDTKLGREVALKILPTELSGDPEREARFHREARALASLQHANVASVYGFEEAAGVRFLVMELISGSELTQRTRKGPVPVDDALNIARQIAAGLEAAHEKGIVHRDLKPDNVMETDEGEVKILDFGLAQAWFGDDLDQGNSGNSLSLTAAMTQVGTILGTAAYMSPEQARGSNVDRRSDIWAFGVILFEMLTGQQLFKGETISDTLAAVLRAEPDWDALPLDEAPGLCGLIRRCLERNPMQRLRDIGEARIFLQDGDVSASSLNISYLSMSAAPAAPPPSRRSPWLVAVVALAALGAGTVLGWQVLARPDPAPLLHTMIPAPRDTQFELGSAAPGPGAISPDGTRVAFTATDAAGVTSLYLRHLDQGESVRMSGTENAAYPFWSPDSEYIGFFTPTSGKLKKVAATGGPPVTLCTADNGKGGSWNADGDIIFAPDASVGIYVVPDIGGEPMRLTRVGSGYNSHRHPRFLPTGDEFIFTARSANEGINAIMLAALDTSVTPRIIAESQSDAEYADGRLLTVRENVLMATEFSPDQERVNAGATPLVENIMSIRGAAVAVFSTSPTGMLIYQTGAADQNGQILAWMDLASGASAPLGEPGQVFHPFISPGGTQAVLEVRDTSNEGTDLWLLDLETGLRTRFTFAGGDERRPCWSHSGQEVFYESVEGGTYRIMRQSVEGQGGATVVLESEHEIAPTSLSPDDRFLLLDYELESSNIELRRIALDAPDGELETVVSAPDANAGGGEYSPDGRWIAYHTESAAGWDVFVIPATGGSRKWQVSTTGTVYPKWNGDGTEIWTSGFNGDLQVFDVDGSGATFRVGDSRESLRVPPPSSDGCGYDLHPDGERLLQAGPDPSFQAEVSQLHLVTDWRRALAR